MSDVSVNHAHFMLYQLWIIGFVAKYRILTSKMLISLISNRKKKVKEHLFGFIEAIPDVG
jgi:hypothetical protein